VRALYANSAKEECNTWWSLQKNIPADVDKKGLENVTGRVPLFLSCAVAALPNWTKGINRIYNKSLAFSKEIEKRMIEEEQWRVNLYVSFHYMSVYGSLLESQS
jgi:hypothetical protein